MVSTFVGPPMQLNRTPRRRIISLTPLIDVVFLLLVFFMLASTFLKFGIVKLETTGGSATRSATDMSKIALIHVGAEKGLRIAGKMVVPSEVSSTLQAQIAAGRSDAVIVLGRGATTSDLVFGLSRVRHHEFASIRVVD